MIWRRIVEFLIVFAVLLAALTIVVRLIEPGFAFFPMAGEAETPLHFGVAYDALTIRTSDGEALHAWRLRGDHPRASIVYFHGNGGNLSNWAPILSNIAGRGYTILAVDYRGYGRSSGRPSERGLYRDVDAVIKAATAERDAAQPVVYWGRSLGATMAAYAATVKQPDGVILEAGFPDARTLLRGSPVLAFLSLFSSYRFSTAEWARSITAPVLMLHGNRDSIVPYAAGRALFEGITAPKQFVTIDGGDHNDALPRDAAAYWRAVDAFVAALRPERR